MSIQITGIEKIGKGRRRISFENGEKLVVYYSETRGLHIEDRMMLSLSEYETLLNEVVGKRAKKRALHLLEQMDRTEQQLRDKLLASEYPARCIDSAIEYVKSFHYLDDERYAETFTRYKKEKMSRQQIKQKLMMKGVARDLIISAIEEEYDVDEIIG